MSLRDPLDVTCPGDVEHLHEAAATALPEVGYHAAAVYGLREKLMKAEADERRAQERFEELDDARKRLRNPNQARGYNNHVKECLASSSTSPSTGAEVAER